MKWPYLIMGFEHGLSWFLFRGLQHFGVDFGQVKFFWTSLEQPFQVIHFCCTLKKSDVQKI